MVLVPLMGGGQDSSFEQEKRNGKERRDFECFRSMTLGYDAGKSIVSFNCRCRRSRTIMKDRRCRFRGFEVI